MSIRDDLWRRHYQLMQTGHYPGWASNGWRPMLLRYWIPIRLLGGQVHFGIYTKARGHRQEERAA